MRIKITKGTKLQGNISVYKNAELDVETIPSELVGRCIEIIEEPVKKLSKKKVK